MLFHLFFNSLGTDTEQNDPQHCLLREGIVCLKCQCVQICMYAPVFLLYTSLNIYLHNLGLCVKYK